MSTMSDLLLGIDIGTTNVKAALATPEGHVVADASMAYATMHPRPGWSEQDPHEWWRGTVETTRTVIKEAAIQPEQIRGIGVSGQGCAVTLIDERGEVIRPAIIWMDARSEAECEILRNRCGDTILRLNGKHPAPYNADPVLMWLVQHEPESIAAAQTSLTSTGYINYRLTNAPVENISDASILHAFDLAQGSWSDELIAAFELPRKLYPALAQCQEIIGGLSVEAAAALGLPPNIPVVAGGEDTSSAGLAIGVAEPGQTLLSLGTAGTIYIDIDQPIVHPQLLAFLHVLPGHTLLGGSMMSGGAGLSWTKSWWPTDVSFEQLTALAAESSVGADGLIFLPYLSGELQPINDGYARGVFFGLSMSTRQEDLIRAVMEGTAYAIAHNLLVAEDTAATVTEIRAVGGPTRSPLWCQIMADVTGHPLAVLSKDAGAPLGNALLAGGGVDLINDVATTAKTNSAIEHLYEPQAEAYEQYAELLTIYQQLYPQLKEQFAALAKHSGARS